MKTNRIMRIRQTGILLVLLFLSTQSFSQSSIEDYVKEGIGYHDKGDYDKALDTDKKALKIDPKSTLVNYEISLSYYSIENYKKAIKYSDAVLKQNKDYMLQAYLTKGSALDMMGKTKKSIKLFKKAIKKTGPHYLLYYNLSYNYYKIEDFENAGKSAIKAIEDNPSHSSSHLLLANIHRVHGNKVQALLAIHYFLLKEPNTKRSSEGILMLENLSGGNVSIESGKPNTINITMSPNDDSEFSAAALMISMLEASNSLEINKDKTEDEIFLEKTKSFFKIRGQMKTEENKGIWWDFYTDFFYTLANGEHLETYCKYITQSTNENSHQWLDDNEVKLAEFMSWLEEL